MNRLQRGDLVVVISGKYKGKQGRIKQVIADEDRVIVEGVNLVKRHTRPNPRNQEGGIVEREAPIYACKVMPVDPQTNQPTRVHVRVNEQGVKARYAKSGAEIRAER